VKGIFLKALKGREKKILRGFAHGLRPVVFIGRQGLSANVVDDIDRALQDHELIKIKFIDFKDEKEVLLSEIEEKTDCRCAGTVGNVAVLYREPVDPEKRKINILNGK